MKVMIVEDDLLVRLGIKSMIPWQQLGMEVVCEARDGMEAVELFESHLPDITLVDIGIPRLNGLDFIERVKPLRPESKFIILTCNQEFDMVRRSLRLGVHDFVVKSTMEIEHLQQNIEQLAGVIRESRQNDDKPGDRRMERDLVRLTKNTLLRDWLNGIYANPAAFGDKLAQCGIPALQGGCAAWVIRLDTLARTGKSFDPADLDKIGYAIENVASELYRDTLIGIVPDVRQRMWRAIFSFAEGAAPGPDLLIEAVERYLGFDISVACSGEFRDCTRWLDADREAEQLLALDYYPHTSRLIFGPGPVDTLPPSVLAWKAAFLRMLPLLHWNDLHESLATVSRLLTAPFPQPALMQHLFHDLNLQIDLFGRKLGHPVYPYGPPSCQHAALQEEIDCVAATVRQLEASLQTGYSCSDRRKLVEAAEHYIREHPFDDISMQHISDYLHVSPNYFSKLFKLETGQSFTDYLLAAKVELAEQMLRSGATPTDISEKLGYLNLSSFTRMFRKIKGVSPSQYTFPDS
ncbi:MAG: response regulator [Paenibacillaceae bacterium]|nr:response regulator [Paenibacillaceae bacterium]